MKKELKIALQEAFEAPEPIQKRKFLRAIPRQSISHFSFVLSQINYIQKREWGISALLFFISISGACYLKYDMFWIISALIPFMGLCMVTESSKSEVYNMEELEMSALFSLKSVIYARMEIVGIVHLFLMIILIPIACVNSKFNMLQTGIYLLVPYLLTSVSGLEITRRVRGKESLAICASVTIIVSGLNAVFQTVGNIIYSAEYFYYWIILFVILAGAVVAECYSILNQTEELKWNLL